MPDQTGSLLGCSKGSCALGCASVMNVLTENRLGTHWHIQLGLVSEMWIQKQVVCCLTGWKRVVPRADKVLSIVSRLRVEEAPVIRWFVGNTIGFRPPFNDVSDEVCVNCTVAQMAGRENFLALPAGFI